MKKNGIHWFGALLLLVIGIAGCSTDKNTARTRFYHSLTTRYNVYFNGNEAYKEGMKAIEDGNKDSYHEIIPLDPISNKKTVGMGAGNFDRAIEKSQKAIKLHSIKKKPPRKAGKNKDPKYKRWMAQREYNPFMHNAWMLMGKAQFQKGEFLEAASTFEYIVRLYETKPEITAEARIWLARCYTEIDWFYDAEDALLKANNDSLPRKLMPQYTAAYGNYLLRQKRFKEAAPYLESIIKKENSKKKKARQYYLLGQVYQEMDDKSKAFNAYAKVISQSPPYELEINARIKQTEVVSATNSNKVIKQLQRMAKNVKNEEYQDQLYYAIGNIYLANNDTVNTIKNYKLGAEKSTRNGIEKGIVLLKLGDVYWAQSDYVEAQKCYSEAIGLLDKDYPAYAQLNKRSEVLDELVTHVVNVQLQDSLQHLATLSEAERLQIIEKIIEEVIKQEEEERKAAEREERMRQREDAIADQPFAERGNQPKAPTIPSGDKSWYFYNQQLVNQGKNDFQRKWGRRKLEDNWRRRNKTVLANETFEEVNYDEDPNTALADSLSASGEAGQATALADSIANDNKNPQFYLQRIPLTEEAMKESNEILSDGLYNMGMIYKDKLEDFSLAQRTFTRLYTKFPDFQNLDEVYYHLFLMNSRWKKSADAMNYKNTLIARFPESKYALTLADPDFEYNALYGKKIEDSLYAASYKAFTEGDFRTVQRNYETARTKYAMGQHMPKFMFLHTMGLLISGERKQFMESLKEIVEKYPENEITEIAANILKGLQEGRLLAADGSAFGSIWKRRKVDLSDDELATDSVMPKFSEERNTPYLFILAYEDGKVNENLLLYEMARYNFSNFIIKNFDLSFVKDNGITMLQTKEFTNFDEAYQYMRLLYSDKEMARKLSGMRAIIISAVNLDLLMKYYSFDDYAEFYEEYLSTIKIPEIEGVLLDEPILFEGVDHVEDDDFY